MAIEKVNSAKLILQRLKIAFEIDKDGDLADFLGVAQSTVSSWKKRDTLDYNIVFAKCKDVNLNWLFFERGPIWYKDVRGDLDYAAEPEGPIYKVKSEASRIKNLPVSPDEKLEILITLIDILEEK
jgi:hypothetical protein